MTYPDDFQEVRSSIGAAFARPEVLGWVRAALARGLTLNDSAAMDPNHHPMRGRGTVYRIEADGVPCVVRRYLRGGGMRFLGDRYLRGTGEPRPVRETTASEEATARGIRTPRVLAWAVYPAGAFYRADLVTRYIPESATLARLLFEAPPTRDGNREAILTAAGGLVADLARAGVLHTDLNARNILLQRADDGGYQPAALDLDRMVVNRPGTPADGGAMLARLERSIRKLAPAGRDALGLAEWNALRSAAGIVAQ